MDPKIEKLLQEMIEGQQKSLLKLARRVVPNVTPEDVMQPNDFPELENHPEFRYDEGTLHGIQMVQIALRNLR